MAEAAEKAPIRVVIADDEPGMRDIIKKILKRAEGFELVAEAKDGQELLSLVEEHRPQLVFLDVEMPEMTGVECARVIQDTDPSIQMIFATAHEQYMKDAFEVYAFDYLVKPFKLERALKSLERLRTQMQRRLQVPQEAPPPAKALPKMGMDRLMLKSRDGVYFLNMEDILLVQRENRATVLYTIGGGRYVTSEPLGELEARLDAKLFFRCHKSYIVNLQQIDNITPYGRWTYIVRLRGTTQDALITHEKYEALQTMFT